MQRLHAVAIPVSQARPVHRAHAQRPHRVGVGLHVGDVVVAVDRAVVVQSRRHRSTPFVDHGAGGAGPDAVLEVADPTGVARLTGVPEAVVVQGEERSVEAAVGTDGGDVVVIAGAADEDAVPGGRGVRADPLGGDVSPLALAVAVRLVHRLKVDQAVAVVPVGDREPAASRGASSPSSQAGFSLVLTLAS